MKKNVKDKLQLLEIIIYFAVFLFITLDGLAPYFGPLPLRNYILFGVGTLIILAETAISFIYPKFLETPRTIFLTFLFMIFAYKTSDMHFSDSAHAPSAMITLLTTTLILFSTLGSTRAWLTGIILYTTTIFTTSNSISLPESVTPEYHFYFSLLLSGLILLNTKARYRAQKLEAEMIRQEEILKNRQSLAEQTGNTTKKEVEEPLLEHTIDMRKQIEKELEDVVYFIERVFRPHSTLAFVYDGNTYDKKKVMTLYSSKSKSLNINNGVQITEGNGIVGEIAETEETFVSGNLTLYNKDLGYYRGNEAVQFVFGVPIISRKKEFLGALIIDFREKPNFRESHKDAMNRFAEIAAALLTNIKMRKDQERNAAQFHLFYESSKSFSATNNNMEIIEELLGFIRKSGEISRATAVAYLEETEECRIIGVSSDSQELQKGHSFKAANSIVMSSMKKSVIEYVTDYSEIRETTPLYAPGESLNPKIKSILIIPFKKTGAEYKIAIVVESYKDNFFNDDEYRESIKTLVKNGSMGYEKAILYQKMQEQATTDGLTKLCNHRTFQEHLHEGVIRSHRYKRPLSLLLMDIDHFKNFNDTYGHQIGDQVLKVIAECLRSTVRSTDLPARYGGEEFVVVLPESGVEDAMRLGERVRANIEQRIINTEKGQLHVTVSIGVATLGVHASTQDQLIATADAAMYNSKKSGRNRVTVYKEGMTVEE